MEFEPTPGQTTEPTQAPTNDPLAELVGEGKPFKDGSALASAKLESDAFITQLKGENFEMRKTVTEMEDKLARASTTTEILEAVRNMQTAGLTQDPPTGGEVVPNENQVPALTEASIEEMIQRTMQRTEQSKVAESNFDLVKAAFMKKFVDPDKARLEYKAAAASLEMTEDQLDAYSKQNPSLVLKAAGLEPAQMSLFQPNYLETKENTEAINKNPNVRDHLWWETQRKANGNAWYFQPKIQQKYWDDARAIGDSFLPEK